MGPVTVNALGCGEKITVNLMIFICANTSKCDYGLGVNNYSGLPISYTLTIDAPPNYTIYAQGLRSSKNYDAFKIVQAPQTATGPKVKIALSCTRANVASGPPTSLR